MQKPCLPPDIRRSNMSHYHYQLLLPPYVQSPDVSLQQPQMVNSARNPLYLTPHMTYGKDLFSSLYFHLSFHGIYELL